MKNTITLDQMLDLLPIVADQSWTVHKHGQIRNSAGACPICAVVNEITGTDAQRINVTNALRSIGYGDISVDMATDMSKFVAAADIAFYYPTPDLNDIRQQIINTLHASEA